MFKAEHKAWARSQVSAKADSLAGRPAGEARMGKLRTGHDQWQLLPIRDWVGFGSGNCGEGAGAR